METKGFYSFNAFLSVGTFHFSFINKIILEILGFLHCII